MVDLFEIHFDDADKFLRYFDASNEDWRNDNWKWKWLFRGMSNPLTQEGNSKWGLTPSIWRTGYSTSLEFIDSLSIPIPENVINRNTNFSDKEKTQAIRAIKLAYVERILIDEFIDLANSLAVRMPNLDSWITANRFLKEYAIHFIDGNIGHHYIWMHPIIALAQHHGIPTRLLDWTENPLIASAFADKSYQDSHDENDKPFTKSIAIYAIHKDMIHFPIYQVSVLNADNHFLHRQKGFLLSDAYGDHYYALHGFYPTFDEAIKTRYNFQFENQLKYPENPYRKITLAVDQLGELRKRLQLRDITLAHLMPSLDNVARTIKNRFGIR